MAGYERKLKKFLIENGCNFHRQGKGDHEMWWSPVSGRFFTVDGIIKSRHMANEVLKQAGVDEKF